MENIYLVIYGQPYSKNRRIKTRDGRVIKSREALMYEKNALLQIPAKYRRLGWGNRNELVGMEINIFYKSWRPDMDETLILDILEKAGVLKNDRWVRERHTYALDIDKDNPRAEITIWRINNG